MIVLKQFWSRWNIVQRVSILGLFVLYGAILFQFGTPFLLRILVETTCFAMLAIALSVQWGYAGVFNAGIAGFIAIGGYATLLSLPPHPDLWGSAYPGIFLRIVLVVFLFVAIALVWRKIPHLPPRLRRFGLIAIFVGGVLVALPWTLGTLTDLEKDFGFIGGFNLPPPLAWVIGAVLAALTAWGIGRICLGLRSDYLAIATLGIAELIRTIFKNTEWLTNGVRPVSPIPWPIPDAGEIGFLWSRTFYLLLVLVMMFAVLWLVHRGYKSPWGRMIRAIRDNERAASAVGKYVDKRRLQCFILGAALMGLAGSVLVNFNGIFDSSSFLPLGYTFLIWVMLIVGGAGNHFGVICGAALVYLFWSQSEVVSLFAFKSAYAFLHDAFAVAIPNDLDARALQMRVFVVGLMIVLVLKFAPNGLFPDQPEQHD